jgi:hypothetical protein
MLVLLIIKLLSDALIITVGTPERPDLNELIHQIFPHLDVLRANPPIESQLGLYVRD